MKVWDQAFMTLMVYSENMADFLMPGQRQRHVYKPLFIGHIQ